MRGNTKKFLNKIQQKTLQTSTGSLLFQIIAINILFIIIVLILNTFVDFQAFHQSLPIGEVIEYQTFAITSLSIIELIVLTGITWRWITHRPKVTSTVQHLIKEGEHEHLEFKASLRWDNAKGSVNKELEYAIARTVAGFMNTNGGVLIIGVNDKGEITGLDQDYKALKKQNDDGFLLHLTTVLHTYLGKEYMHLITARIVSLNKQNVCRVNIRPSHHPVYVSHLNQEEFFIRAGASTQPMQIREAHAYIAMHWPKHKARF